MNELAPIIKDLAIILSVAGIVVLLFQKIRQPIVLGYIVAGIIVGPHTPPYSLVVKDITTVKVLSELGVIFLMFSLGLNFSFHKLTRVGFSVGAAGIFETAIMMLLGFAAGRFIGWPFYESLFFGAAISISSTTIVAKALDELKLKGKRFANIVLGVLVVEDLLAIILMVALSTVVITKHIFSLSMLLSIINLIIVVGGWFLIGYFLVPTLFNRIKNYASQETITIVSVALCLFLVSVAAHFHYSSALAAFIMGSILAETPLANNIEQTVRPMRDLFAAVFFISVGMLIDPKIVMQQWQYVLLISIFVIAGKILSVTISSFLTGQSYKTSLRVGFSLAQIGELSFIIAGLGISLHVTNSSIYQLLIISSAVTAFVTPYFIKLSGHINNQLDNVLPKHLQYILDSYSAWVYRISIGSSNISIYRKVVTQLVLNGIVVAIVFALTNNLILPEMVVLIDPIYLAQTISWAIAIVLSSSFIWGMLFSFTPLSLIEQNRTKLVMPLFLIWLVTIVEIAVLSEAYFHNWLVMLTLIVITILLFSLLHKQLEKSYLWFRRRLLSNIRKIGRKQARYEELAPWDTHLVEITVPANFPFLNKTLSECDLRQKFGINIVAIKRGSQIISAPRGEARMLPYDQLIILGNDEQIDSFKKTIMGFSNSEQEDSDLLKNFALKGIILEQGSPLVGKTIRDSKIREQTHGVVVGLERERKHILNPDYFTTLKVGDMLLIVGEEEFVNRSPYKSFADNRPIA